MFYLHPLNIIEPLYGDETYNDLSKFKNIYKYTKNMGMKLKAHVGEFGDAKDIINIILFMLKEGIVIDDTLSISILNFFNTYISKKLKCLV